MLQHLTRKKVGGGKEKVLQKANILSKVRIIVIFGQTTQLLPLVHLHGKDTKANRIQLQIAFIVFHQVSWKKWAICCAFTQDTKSFYRGLLFPRAEGNYVDEIKLKGGYLFRHIDEF